MAALAKLTLLSSSMHSLSILHCGSSLIHNKVWFTNKCVFEVPEIVELDRPGMPVGAVTTGAVTVAIILGLGVGIMTSDRKKRGVQCEANPLDSFGIVTLTLLYPVIGMTLLANGLICRAVVTEEEIMHDGVSLTHGAFKRTLLLISLQSRWASALPRLCSGLLAWSRVGTVTRSCIGYTLALALTVPSKLEYVAVAWECAGVTTSSSMSVKSQLFSYNSLRL